MLEATEFFKCLSDDTRLNATLLIYQEGELCVCELVEALNDSQPKISRHLAQLRSCGILDDSRRGQWVFYSVAKKLPAWALEVLHAAHRAHSDTIKVLQKKPEGDEESPSMLLIT